MFRHLIHIYNSPWNRSISAESYLHASAYLFFVVIISTFLGLFVIGDTFYNFVVENKITALSDIISGVQIINLIKSMPLVLSGSMLLFLLTQIIFLSYFSIKITILRLHDFNLSGWYSLPIILFPFGLGFINFLELVLNIFFNVVSFLQNFYNPKINKKKWEENIYEYKFGILRSSLIFMYSLIVWWSILSSFVFPMVELL